MVTARATWMTEVVVGVDGGGTKTRVIVAGLDGVQLGEAVGPGSATGPGRSEASAAVIGAAVREALAAAGESKHAVKIVVAGVAGAGRANEQRALLEALEDLELAENVIVVGDGEIALTDAFDGSAGIMLTAGTGSIAYGRSPTNVIARCGGWGSVFGDEGSGAWIGRRALSIVASAADGREPPTALTGAILTAAQLNEPSELIPWGIAATPMDFAALAPVVFNAAASGDVRANSLLALAVEELLLHVRALAIKLFGDDRAAIPVAFAGGLLQKGSPLRKRLEHRLKSSVPGAQMRTGEIIAARGAVKTGLATLRVPIKTSGAGSPRS